MKKWRSASKPAVGDSRYGQSTFFPTTFGFLLLHILDQNASCPLLFLARVRASFCCNMSRPPGSRHAARLPLFRSDLNTSMLLPCLTVFARSSDAFFHGAGMPVRPGSRTFLLRLLLWLTCNSCVPGDRTPLLCFLASSCLPGPATPSATAWTCCVYSASPGHAHVLFPATTYHFAP